MENMVTREQFEILERKVNQQSETLAVVQSKTEEIDKDVDELKLHVSDYTEVKTNLQNVINDMSDLKNTQAQIVTSLNTLNHNITDKALQDEKASSKWKINTIITIISIILSLLVGSFGMIFYLDGKFTTLSTEISQNKTDIAVQKEKVKNLAPKDTTQ